MKDLTLVNSNERLDDLGIKDYHIIQNPEVFCFGIDAVLLAHFAKVTRASQKIVDIGTGTGIIPILMHAIYEKGQYTGIDIQEMMVEMANRSVKFNGIEANVTIKQVDVKVAKEHFDGCSVDVVTCNPPYMKGEAGLKNEHPSKIIARHEVECSLEDIIAAASYMLKFRGKVCMIHRPHRLVDIMTLMRKYKVEPKRMQMVYPKIGKAPTMVLVEGVRGGAPELRVEEPLVVYEQDGSYTRQLKAIYGIDE